jgi:hypothetical protein
MVNLDIRTLHAFVTVSRRSARQLGREAGWLGANLSSALNGNRKFPAEKKPALLRALGLDEDGRPLPGEVLSVSGDIYREQSELNVALKSWFPNGGVYRISVPKHRPGTGGLYVLSVITRETTFLLYDGSKTRVVLIAKKNDDIDIDQCQDIYLFSNNDLAKLKFSEAGERVEVDKFDYQSLTSNILSTELFDKIFGSTSAPQLSWEDVIAVAKAKGFDPARLLELLKLHGDV